MNTNGSTRVNCIRSLPFVVVVFTLLGVISVDAARAVPNSVVRGPSPTQIACCLADQSCTELAENACASQGGHVASASICEGDVDDDGVDGVCGDACPSDGGKTVPGACGCGIADTDTDTDGTPNCNDGCPADAGKTSPGLCGCGVSDVDTDLDGAPDCTDGCPSNPNMVAPSACGCVVAVDTDGDTVPDCHDLCDGADDTVDTNDNGVPDCIAGDLPIPTVTTWGMVIMGLMLLTAGKIRFGMV